MVEPFFHLMNCLKILRQDIVKIYVMQLYT
jgi:hypothetical protein